MIARIQNPDTPADTAIQQVLANSGCFVMVSGAGSGKTTSLVKAMGFVANSRRKEMLRSGRQIACITYTEVAEEELAKDLGHDPLCHISTIHSFLWQLIRPFQTDIRELVIRHNEERLAKLLEKEAKFGPRVQPKTRHAIRQEIEECEALQTVIPGVPRFTYETGRDYRNGILGHDDIIKLVPTLLLERPLLRTVVVQKYPVFFFDESQDTDDAVVDALKAVAADAHRDSQPFCLGFFGDPMQKIYTAGRGTIEPLPGWEHIRKVENFRSSAAVLATINRIRQDADGLVQTPGSRMKNGAVLPTPAGSAYLFILPVTSNRETSTQTVRAFVARKNEDPAWASGDANADVKLLVIEHAMAANRLGFGRLFEVFNQGGDSPKMSFREGKHWALAPFLSVLLPLVEAVQAGHDYVAMTILRGSPALDPDRLRSTHDIAALLASLKDDTRSLCDRLAPASTAPVGEILRFAHERGLVALDGRITRALRLPATPPAEALETDAAALGEDTGTPTPTEELLLRYLDCPAVQIRGYRSYIENRSVYATQQGIKGAEFQRVMVVIDDEESNHFLFSYDKLFGLEALSDTDQRNLAAGNDTAVERTRRLFYVCCSRALKDLVVVCYTSQPEILKTKVCSAGLFSEDRVFGEQVLAT